MMIAVMMMKMFIVINNDYYGDKQKWLIFFAMHKATINKGALLGFPRGDNPKWWIFLCNAQGNNKQGCTIGVPQG